MPAARAYRHRSRFALLAGSGAGGELGHRDAEDDVRTARAVIHGDAPAATKPELDADSGAGLGPQVRDDVAADVGAAGDPDHDSGGPGHAVCSPRFE